MEGLTAAVGLEVVTAGLTAVVAMAVAVLVAAMARERVGRGAGLSVVAAAAAEQEGEWGTVKAAGWVVTWEVAVVRVAAGMAKETMMAGQEELLAPLVVAVVVLAVAWAVVEVTGSKLRPQ